MTEKPRSLRQRQRDLTRRSIVDAVAHVVLEQGAHGFSAQDVADRSGVSLRTVYRYFPTRDDLVRGLAEEVGRAVKADAGPAPRDLDGCVAEIRASFRRFGTIEHIVRAYARTVDTTPPADSEVGDALRAVLAQRHAREQSIRLLVDVSLPHLSERARAQISAVARLLASSVGWSALTSPAVGLSSDEAGEAVGWAIRAMVEHAQGLDAGGNTPLASEDEP